MKIFCELHLSEILGPWELYFHFQVQLWIFCRNQGCRGNGCTEFVWPCHSLLKVAIHYALPSQHVTPTRVRVTKRCLCWEHTVFLACWETARQELGRPHRLNQKPPFVSAVLSVEMASVSWSQETVTVLLEAYKQYPAHAYPSTSVIILELISGRPGCVGGSQFNSVLVHALFHPSKGCSKHGCPSTRRIVYCHLKSVCVRAT